MPHSERVLTVSRHWVETLTRLKRVRGYGSPSNYRHLDNLKLATRKIYKVSVCRFEFVFTDLNEIREYIEYYSSKTHPSTRAYVGAADHWEVQTRFTSLPRSLMNNHNRPRVLMGKGSGLVLT